MYSPFSPSSRRDFIKQELKCEYLSFPDEIAAVYSSIYSWLSQIIPNFDVEGPPSNLDTTGDDMVNRLNTGREFTYLLPGHVMKVYQTFLISESESFDKYTGSVLDKPNISIVDDGCGSGTASIALISLIINYQKYRLINNLPIFPITINCLGIDPNDRAFKIYGKFLSECVSKIKHFLIDLKDIKMFPGTLPENSARITEWLDEQSRVHCTVLALANVIRPLTNQYVRNSKRRSIFEVVGLGKLLPDGWGIDIGTEEIATLGAILRSKTDQIVMLLIGAYSHEYTGIRKSRKRWQVEMTAFQNTLNAKLAKLHQVNIAPIKQRRLMMVNPTNSFHRKHWNRQYSPEIEYDSGFVIIQNRNYVEDIDWQKILELDNLMLAWARVRNALSFEMLEDTIEVRLFEANIEEKLNKLRGEILSYQWELLNVAEMLNFRVPKGLDKAPRPISLCRLEDQILATAILQIKAQEYSTAHHPRSYAYKLLVKQKSEHFYEDWFQQYQEEYIAEARKIAQQHPSYFVIRTDLSSYYTDIVQSKLFKAVEGSLGLYDSRGNILAEKLINRDCGVEKIGQGIPQGHIISGALSNLYLAKVDHLFGSGNSQGVEYFRFVDDIILMFPPNVKAEFILDQLDRALSDLGLTRSKDKTSRPMTAQEFLELTNLDDTLERLSKEHNFLLSDLYKLGRNYILIALADWWIFVEHYQKLLVSIGVYFSVPRLSRKLQKNLRWWRRTFNWWYKLEMPKVKHLADLKDVDRWKSEFIQCQSESTKRWINRRENLVQELLTLFRNSLANLESELEVERTRAKTCLKFALNRLGQLGFGEEANTIVNLIVERPWVLHVRRVCHDLALQGREDLLIDAFNRTSHQDGSEWGYVRGAILKAFSSLPSVNDDVILLLQDAAFNGKTILERTMASEALFLLQRAQSLQRDELIKATKQSEDDYLSKNYVLLHTLAPGEGEVLRADLTQGRVLNEALEFIRVVPAFDQLHYYEPDILREKFYEGDYPDDPTEFEDFPY